MIPVLLVTLGLLKTTVAVPMHLAEPRKHSSGLDCTSDKAKEDGSNYKALCEHFEIIETGDWTKNANGDGNGDEMDTIFNAGYTFKADFLPGQAITKSEISKALDGIEKLAGFKKDGSKKQEFVHFESLFWKSCSDGVDISFGTWEVPVVGGKWRGAIETQAKNGKIIQCEAKADKETRKKIEEAYAKIQG